MSSSTQRDSHFVPITLSVEDIDFSVPELRKVDGWPISPEILERAHRNYFLPVSTLLVSLLFFGMTIPTSSLKIHVDIT